MLVPVRSEPKSTASLSYRPKKTHTHTRSRTHTTYLAHLLRGRSLPCRFPYSVEDPHLPGSRQQYFSLHHQRWLGLGLVRDSNQQRPKRQVRGRGAVAGCFTGVGFWWWWGLEWACVVKGRVRMTPRTTLGIKWTPRRVSWAMIDLWKISPGEVSNRDDCVDKGCAEGVVCEGGAAAL